MKFLTSVCLFASLTACTGIRSTHTPNSIDGFSSWITGHDPSTIQLLPSTGNNALAFENKHQIVHVKFEVKQYGEVSFPININTSVGEEAIKVDLSGSKQIQITYQANREFILQLRQTGVHGGVHNHITLPPAAKSTTVTVTFSEFKGGKTELDLTDVAKFNFAFLFNNTKDGFAELKIRSFKIDGYKP